MECPNSVNFCAGNLGSNTLFIPNTLQYFSPNISLWRRRREWRRRRLAPSRPRSAAWRRGAPSTSTPRPPTPPAVPRRRPACRSSSCSTGTPDTVKGGFTLGPSYWNRLFPSLSVSRCSPCCCWRGAEGWRFRRARSCAQSRGRRPPPTRRP